MNSKRLHSTLLGVIILMAIGLIAGAYGANSMLAKESQKLAGLKAKSQALEQEQIGLVAAKKSIKKYAELENIAHTIVPEDKNQAEAVIQIVGIAAANGVTLSSINFPASSLGAKVAAPSSAAAATPSAASGAASAGSKTSQLQSVKNISGVYQLPITIANDSNHPVQYAKFINFLNALEHNRRTAQVSSITLQPDTQNRNNLTFTLILNEYIKP